MIRPQMGKKQISESGGQGGRERGVFWVGIRPGDKSTSPAKDSAAQLKMLQTEARASGPYDAVALHCDRSKGPLGLGRRTHRMKGPICFLKQIAMLGEKRRNPARKARSIRCIQGESKTFRNLIPATGSVACLLRGRRSSDSAATVEVGPHRSFPSLTTTWTAS